MNALVFSSRALKLLLLLLISIYSLPINAATKAAVVIGIAAYDESLGANPLRYADRDAGLVADALKKQGYAVSTLLNGQATQHNILDTVQQVTKQLRV